MSTIKTKFTSEGILLLRNDDGVTMAIHFTEVAAILEAVAKQNPDIDLGFAKFYANDTLDHYKVDAHGKADRLFMWIGPDPFAKAEIESPKAEVEA